MRATDSRRSGFLPVLVAAYTFFALAAGARAGYQLATQAEQAPLAYTLSALAAALYLLAAQSLRGTTRASLRLALACLATELAGVLTIGALSHTSPSLFADQTVWSDYGGAYAYLPLALPTLGLTWIALARRRRRGASQREVRAHRPGRRPARAGPRAWS